MTLTEFKAFAANYDELLRSYRLSGNLEELYEFVVATMQEHQEPPHGEQFIEALTTSEEKAYKAIIEEIGDEGNISVVKMIQKTNLSRPVWTSLLQKMEKYNVAIIKNQGVKGTHIILLGDKNGNL